jgi:tRNA(fMet)-specific endonuclease VapC
MRYLLDTNVISDIASKPNGRIARKVARFKAGRVGTSHIVIGEILFGLRKISHPALEKNIKRTLRGLDLAPWTDHVAEHYGKIRATLESQGLTIGNNDLWIAAHALSQRLIVVTRNEKEFSRVPGLKVENWEDR